MWGKNIILAERSRKVTIPPSHPEYKRREDKRRIESVRLCREVSETTGRTLRYWVRWGVIDGTAYRGGQQYRTKREAERVFRSFKEYTD